MMQRYRKKPVVVEAIQYTGEFENFCKINRYFAGNAFEQLEHGETYLIIHTVDGDIKVECGDYIIKGVNGEFYPCKLDIFEKTYEKVD